MMRHDLTVTTNNRDPAGAILSSANSGQLRGVLHHHELVDEQRSDVNRCDRERNSVEAERKDRDGNCDENRRKQGCAYEHFESGERVSISIEILRNTSLNVLINAKNCAVIPMAALRLMDHPLKGISIVTRKFTPAKNLDNLILRDCFKRLLDPQPMPETRPLLLRGAFVGHLASSSDTLTATIWGIRYMLDDAPPGWVGQMKEPEWSNEQFDRRSFST